MQKTFSNGGLKLLRSDAGPTLSHLVVVGFVGVYFSLLVLAVACPQDPRFDKHAQHGQGHHGPAGHSVLCGWACQVSSHLDLTPLDPIRGPVLGVVALLNQTHETILPSVQRLIPARGPPVPGS